jgi:hypothetical protein
MSTRLLAKPLIGGPFGQGRYSLATTPCVSNGLHAVKYMVVDPRGGAVLSVADDKPEALAGARQVLRAANDLHGIPARAVPVQLDFGFEELAVPCSGLARGHVSRRRREIFQRTAGLCFYCRGELRIDGEWHVEHQRPRALGGGNDPLNLVAACVACNLRKGDRTAIEFITQGEQQ